MELPTGNEQFFRMSVDSFDTDKVLANAAKQRDRRNLQDVLIVDTSIRTTTRANRWPRSWNTWRIRSSSNSPARAGRSRSAAAACSRSAGSATRISAAG